MNLKQSLRSGADLFGTWVTVEHPTIIEVACSSEFDWVTIDLEHSSISPEAASLPIQIGKRLNKKVLPRMADHSGTSIKKVMDAGADGVIVPMINTRSELDAVVNHVYYPPKGKRGVGLSYAQGFGMPGAFDAYKAKLDAETVIMCQIEHIEAIDHLDEIFSHSDLDGFILGPYDLSASMGYPGDLDHPAVGEVIEAVAKKASEHKISGGLHLVEPEIGKLEEYRTLGFNLFVYSVEFRILDAHYRKVVRELKGGRQ